jgi:hypothetical protein
VSFRINGAKIRVQEGIQTLEVLAAVERGPDFNLQPPQFALVAASS